MGSQRLDRDVIGGVGAFTEIFCGQPPVFKSFNQCFLGQEVAGRNWLYFPAPKQCSDVRYLDAVFLAKLRGGEFIAIREDGA